MHPAAAAGNPRGMRSIRRDFGPGLRYAATDPDRPAPVPMTAHMLLSLLVLALGALVAWKGRRRPVRLAAGVALAVVALTALVGLGLAP